jgi:tRNA U34 2-thiouridine synthase MnmA/TrmU
MGGKGKGIGLLSGGLDSLLAVAILKEQGIDMLGINFYNGFSPGTFRRDILGEASVEEGHAEKEQKLKRILGIPVRVVDVSEEFLEMIASPRHGYGKNVNPCIDCRIFLLRKAKKIMEEEGADFVFTGEVLGQRPMSQHRKALDVVERESGLEGILLRPLSARLLPISVPEREGLVDRDRLFDIQGRSRRRQMELARELGIEEYTQPAGGCTLTDENYARRFRDLVDHRQQKALTRREAVLLAVGRHFRLSPAIRAVAGRHEAENDYLEREWKDGLLLAPADIPGPTVLVQGEPGEREIRAAAAIAARYSDGKNLPEVRIAVGSGEEARYLLVEPIEDSELERFRI